MRCLAHRIRSDLTKPRWVTAEQYQWLLMNEGERHGWFSRWVHTCRREFTHWWVPGDRNPHPSYKLTPGGAS